MLIDPKIMQMTIGVLHEMIKVQPKALRNTFISRLRRNLTEFIADKKLNLRQKERKLFRDTMSGTIEKTDVTPSNDIDLAFVCYIQDTFEL